MSAEHARLARRKRARALRSIADSDSLRVMLDRVPFALRRVEIFRLLCACPGIGEVTARRILEETRTWPLIAVGDLPATERAMISSKIPERIP